jgi:hypothetical protein
MMEETDTLVPVELIPELEAVAAEEDREASAVVGDAVTAYLKDRRWRRLLANMEGRARELGLTEEDVPRLIAESRREARQGS